MSYIVLDEKTMQAQCCMTRQDVLEFFLRQEGNRKKCSRQGCQFPNNQFKRSYILIDTGTHSDLFG